MSLCAIAIAAFWFVSRRYQLTTRARDASSTLLTSPNSAWNRRLHLTICVRLRPSVNRKRADLMNSRHQGKRVARTSVSSR
jgi:hypothetical protein